MESRRDFLRKAAALTGSAVGWNAMPKSIQAALAINPDPGSTFLDAEHVVILMQENRSFDHCYGTLQGVRGFNDPRAFVLPNKNPVWLQTNEIGETYAPFRLDIKETNATWMGSLPHSWDNQVNARNRGRYDRWLPAKPSGYEPYAKMPLTLGHYTREDIPFYYAFADAFTVCDQHFCSSLTGTTPNRLYLWTGTIREKPDASSPAKVYNEEADFDHEVSWTTFPERLEDHGISWKIYQNEITIESGFQGEEESWLSNYGDNPLEYFSQYRVRFSAGHRAYLDKRAQELAAEIERLTKRTQTLPDTDSERKGLQKQLQENTKLLAEANAERRLWSLENFEKLSSREKNLHKKAFCTNGDDPHYRELETLTYQDGDTQRTVQVPKGDVLLQFRQDVQTGQLPTVSWLVGPENFSDHPSSAWYGAWYVSEVLDILTRNPKVWKKTVLILTYDENDGYFDHVPPFVAPDPARPETGRVSAGLDTGGEFVDKEQDRAARPGYPPQESSIGLGYRVPMVIASPWSRGGCVCSEVFDHTSVLQFLETLLTYKTGQKIEETNITPWRRTVCGDLTSVFRPYRGETITVPPFPPRNAFIEGIHKAKFQGLPSHSQGLTAEEITQIKNAPMSSPLLPKQEAGIRRSCPLPYQFAADGALNADRTRFQIRLAAQNDVFGKHSAGAPFHVYAYHGPDMLEARAYAVTAGNALSDEWPLAAFETGRYHLRVDGPNGFHREFRGTAGDPALEVQVRDVRAGRSLTGQVEVYIINRDSRRRMIQVSDNAYGTSSRTKRLAAGSKAKIVMETKKSHGWYDFSIRLADAETWEYRYAGRVETGQWSFTDPAMGRSAARLSIV